METSTVVLEGSMEGGKRLDELEAVISSLYQLAQRSRHGRKHSGYPHEVGMVAMAGLYRSVSPDQSVKDILASSTAEDDHQVSAKEVQATVSKVIDERDQLAAEREQLKQVVEAARRERVLAIDERDKLLHRHHMLKLSLERNEATLKLIESEKAKLATRCMEVEQELTSLRQALDSAQRSQQELLNERAKSDKERNLLREEMCSLQAERDTLLADKIRLQADLHSGLSSQLHQKTELERLQASYKCMEKVAHSLQQQLEVLCEKSCQLLQVVMQRSARHGPWGFSVEGGHGTEYFSGDSSIVVTGVAANTPAMSSLRYGDRLVSVEGHSLDGLTKSEAIELLSSLAAGSTLRLTLKRACPPDRPQPLTVQLPGRWPFGFSYHSQYIITGSESHSDLLHAGDRIVKVMGNAVDGLRSSQMRKLLKSCRNGLTLDLERTSKHYLPSLHPPHQGSSETSRRGHDNHISLTTTTSLHSSHLHEEDSVISPSPQSISTSAMVSLSSQPLSLQLQPNIASTNTPSLSSVPQNLPSTLKDTNSKLLMSSGNVNSLVLSSLSLRQTDV